ncbi:acetylcholine receptor subunit [Mactra antiquata]
MSWPEDSFNGILNLFVPQDDIWKPDIMLRNSFTSMKEQGSSFLRAIVTRNGNVIWAPSQVFESTCSMSITYFPFDEQTCSLRFSAWSYGKTDVVLTVSDEGIQLPEYVKSATWDLVNTASGDVNNGDPEVFFKFTLRRKPSNCLRCKRCRKQSIVPVNTELSEQKRNKGSDIVTDVSKTDLEEEAGQSMTTWLDVINAMDFIFFVLSIVYTFICTLVIGIIVVIYS